MAKLRKQDFLSQEHLKRTARGVTFYLAPRQGGKSAILEVDRVSGQVGLRQLSAGSLKGGKMRLQMKRTGAAKRVAAAKKSPWTGEWKTIQRLAGR